MLADCVILFRNLARMYPDKTSSQFLSLLYAYVHFLQQNNLPEMNPSTENLRMFLEPNLVRSWPTLDIKFHFALDSIIEDAIRAYYTRPSHTADLLIQNIFVTHFDEAIPVLREVIENSSIKSITIHWALHTISDIFLFVSDSNRATLLQIVNNAIGHYNTKGFIDAIALIFQYLWRAGLLDDALALLQIKYLQSCSSIDEGDVHARLWWFQMSHHFVLCNMGRLSDAIQMIQETKVMTLDPGGDFFLLPCII
ncbi:hypothetical protein B0H19DRAFT_1247254 [Mycena capillaripes]|nr:hypothetical protein B0H19DRAFT_1247254 [Mycena capillaripes]